MSDDDKARSVENLLDEISAAARSMIETTNRAPIALYCASDIRAAIAREVGVPRSLNRLHLPTGTVDIVECESHNSRRWRLSSFGPPSKADTMGPPWSNGEPAGIESRAATEEQLRLRDDAHRRAGLGVDATTRSAAFLREQVAAIEKLQAKKEQMAKEWLQAGIMGTDELDETVDGDMLSIAERKIGKLQEENLGLRVAVEQLRGERNEQWEKRRAADADVRRLRDMQRDPALRADAGKPWERDFVNGYFIGPEHPEFKQPSAVAKAKPYKPGPVICCQDQYDPDEG